MLQELGFHKTAVFFPFPEYWSGKLGINKLQKARNGLNRLARKYRSQTEGQLHYIGLGGKHSKLVAEKHYPESLERGQKYMEMRDVMDKAIRLHLGHRLKHT